MCPACGSRRVRVLIPEGSQDNLFKLDNFRVFQDRQCKECGRRWTPACPRWAAYCCCAAGLALLGCVAVIAVMCFREAGGAAALLMAAVYGSLPGVGGAFALYYGVGALTGRLGRLRMR